MPERFVRSVSGKNGRPIGLPEPPAPRRVFSPQISYLITHILADRDARIPTFGYLSPLNLPFRAAVKTGTSKDFRDNWTIGYTPDTTVGVWVGNFDGSPMHSVSGVTGAGPLFRDIMLHLEAGKADKDFSEPPGIVRSSICPLSGLKPSPACPATIEEIFIAGTEPREECPLSHLTSVPARAISASRSRTRDALEIDSPRDGDVFKIDPVLRLEFQTLRLRASLAEDSDGATVEWWINQRKVGASGTPYVLPWAMRPGTYVIQAKAILDGAPVESRPVKIRVLS